MRFEDNEKRDFRPCFFQKLSSLDTVFLLERKYGHKLGFSESDYLASNSRIRFCSRNDVLRAECVVSIRTPALDQLEMLEPGAIFFSMLHFLTRVRRNEFLTKKQVRMFSMDSVVDDFGVRMIQDFPGSVENAFRVCYANLPCSSKQGKLRVLILGSGEIGKLAADIAIQNSQLPTIVTVVGRSVTQDTSITNSLLRNTDVLVDASKRHKTHISIISNEQLGLLPQDALIMDLSADDYDTNVSPIQIKGIEGIPTGNLDQYLFAPDDPAYEKIPPGVRTTNRRTLISCNAWPGIDPIRCLNRYELQLDPFIRLLASNNIDFALSSDNPYERALARATYDHFLLRKG